MKTSSLRTVLPLTLTALLFACASPAASTSSNEGDDTSGDPASTSPAPNTSKPVTPPAATPSPTPVVTPPPVVSAIVTAKVHAAPVWSYAVADTANFVVTDTTVERTAPDGTTPAEIPALAAAVTVATDGTRVYGFLDNDNGYELYSMMNDGTDGQHHLNWSWNNGDPSALSVFNGRVYFTSTRDDSRSHSMVVSASATPPLGGGNVSTTVEDYVDARALPPAFAADRLFAVDFYRGSAATRMMFADSAKAVDVIHASVPDGASGIATDGVDVYTRTAQGIVKVAIGSGQDSAPIVVVPSAACSLFDPADGTSSVLDDALVISGGNIYTACRAGVNVEVRAYALAGTLAKVVAAQPYNGGVSHLRVTSTAVYWMAQTSLTSSDNELWRAAK